MVTPAFDPYDGLVTDEVTRLDGPPAKLGNLGFFGFDLKGFTRVDETGNCFATRWFVILGIPVFPLNRYYLKQGDFSISPGSMTTPTVYSTSYEIAGSTPLRGSEAIRTLAYCFGTLALAILPPYFIIKGEIDSYDSSDPSSGDSGLAIIGSSFWFLAVFLVSYIFIKAYRRRWAPVRKARFSDE